MSAPGGCAQCLTRTWLLGQLAGHLDTARARLGSLLQLPDAELIDAIGGRRTAELHARVAGFDAESERARGRAAGLEAVCRCDAAYPSALRDLPAPPATLHVSGGLDRFSGLLARGSVAIVGARRASPYGCEVARSLSAALASAEVTVVSGMAEGIDAAAHGGALQASAPTIAVVAGGAERPYPRGQRGLHRRIVQCGAVVSELGPGVAPRRWMFPARNRIIAALSAMTVVVEARSGSGALITADWARRLDRGVGAVPGQITSPLAHGTHDLLAHGAVLVTGAQDVLDALYGVGRRLLAPVRRPRLDAAPAALLDAIAEGHDADSAFARAGLDIDRGLAALASLELAGLLRRAAGGRFVVVA